MKRKFEWCFYGYQTLTIVNSSINCTMCFYGYSLFRQNISTYGIKLDDDTYIWTNLVLLLLGEGLENTGKSPINGGNYLINAGL